MSSTNAAYALAGGMVGGLIVVFIIFYVLVVIAFWKIFTKAGIAGWKSIIPIYNEFYIFKISWNTKMFWIALALCVVGSILCCLDPGMQQMFSTSTSTVAVSDVGAMYYIGALLDAAGSIILLIAWYHLGKSFGHGVPFFILSIFFPNVMTLYLGFNSDKYLGNLSEE